MKLHADLDVTFEADDGSPVKEQRKVEPIDIAVWLTDMGLIGDDDIDSLPPGWQKLEWHHVTPTPYDWTNDFVCAIDVVDGKPVGYLIFDSVCYGWYLFPDMGLKEFIVYQSQHPGEMEPIDTPERQRMQDRVSGAADDDSV